MKFQKIFFWTILLPFFHCVGYDAGFFRYSDQSGLPDAVGVVAYNRPQYLCQLLGSLENTPEADTLPFFFFLDGGDPQATDENIRLIQNAAIRTKEIILRETNYGCPKNHIDAKRFLFDWCHFQRVVVMEEDVIVTKSYFNVLFQLYDWAQSRYSNIGTVQLWTRCKLEPGEKEGHLYEVQETMPYWSLVTYCMGKEAWDAIAQDLYHYETFLDPMLGNPRYQLVRSKPTGGPTANACKTWVRKRINAYNNGGHFHEFATDRPQWVSDIPLSDWTANLSLSQDKITTLFLRMHGFVRLQTVVNRVSHIGIQGIINSHHKVTPLLEFEEEGEDLPFSRKN